MNLGGGSGFDHGTSSMEAIHMVEETRQSDAGLIFFVSCLSVVESMIFFFF